MARLSYFPKLDDWFDTEFVFVDDGINRCSVHADNSGYLSLRSTFPPHALDELNVFVRCRVSVRLDFDAQLGRQTVITRNVPRFESCRFHCCRHLGDGCCQGEKFNRGYFVWRESPQSYLPNGDARLDTEFVFVDDGINRCSVHADNSGYLSLRSTFPPHALDELNVFVRCRVSVRLDFDAQLGRQTVITRNVPRFESCRFHCCRHLGDGCCRSEKFNRGYFVWRESPQWSPIFAPVDFKSVPVRRPKIRPARPSVMPAPFHLLRDLFVCVCFDDLFEIFEFLGIKATRDDGGRFHCIVPAGFGRSMALLDYLDYIDDGL